MDNTPHNGEQNHKFSDWQDKEFHYRRLFETAPDGILVVDAETGNIIDVNPILIDRLGYPRQDIINKLIWELGFLKPLFSDKSKLDEFKQKDFVYLEDLPLETSTGEKLNVNLLINSYEVEHQKLIQLRLQLSRLQKEAEFKFEKVNSAFTNLSRRHQLVLL